MLRKLILLLSTLGATVFAEGEGDATYYEGTVANGACADKGLTIPAGVYGVALADPDWDDFAHCGWTMNVHGPNGATITAMVIDRCMGCLHNDIDLVTEAFAQLADLAEGRIRVTWEWTG